MRANPVEGSRRRWAYRLGVLVVVAVLGVLAYQVTRTALALRDAETRVDRVREALDARDLDTAQREAVGLRDAASTARGHSDGLLWRAAGLLPWAGDDMTAVAKVAVALDEVARVAPSGFDVVREVQERGLRTADGSIDLATVSSLEPAAAELAQGTRAAAGELADVDTATLVGRIAPKVSRAIEQVDELQRAAEGIDVATKVLPDVLGANGARRYLLVVQNNSEIRATGGLPGSASVLSADDGSVSLGFQGSALDLDGGSAAVAPFLPGEREVFGPLLVSDFRDTNFTPDFPRAAQLMAAFADRSRGEALDGVVSVDPVLLSRVLRVTGPVVVDGRELDADNAVRELLYEPYVRLQDPDAQDAYFQRAARAIFSEILGDGGDEVALLRTLAEGASQRRLLFFSADESVQDEIAPTSIAGALPTGTGRPEVGFYLNDGTQAKMQYFLRSDASIVSEGCDADGRQVVRARLSLVNDLDVPLADLTDFVTGDGSKAPRGTSLMQLRMFAPEGGRLVGLEIDGERADVGQASVYGREVTQTTIELAPDQRTEVVAQFAGRAGEVGDPRLEMTPGIVWGPSHEVATARC